MVENIPARDQVFFGAWVLLRRDDGSQIEYRIVGPDEADAALDSISIDAPLARALLKKKVGDEARLDLEARREDFVIEQIRYE